MVALICAGCEADADPLVDSEAALDGSLGTATLLDATPSEPLEVTAEASTSAPRLDAARLDAAPERDDAACEADGGAPRLGEAIVMHACLHGSDGPFRVVTGSSSAEAAPDVSRAHTLFTVLAGTGERVHVRYAPAAAGDHVLFLARGELTAAEQAGSSLALELRDVECAVLPRSYLMQLAGVEPVELTLRADSDRVALVIEPLASWGVDAWQPACGAGPISAADAGTCRSNGPCSSDAECCSYCHDYDHCH